MPTFPRELRRDVGDEREEGDDVEAEVLRGGEVPRRRLQVFRALRSRHVLEQPDGVVHRVVPLQRQQVRQLVDVVVVAGKVFGPSINYVRLDILPLSPLPALCSDLQYTSATHWLMNRSNPSQCSADVMLGILPNTYFSKHS